MLGELLFNIKKKKKKEEAFIFSDLTGKYLEFQVCKDCSSVIQKKKKKKPR